MNVFDIYKLPKIKNINDDWSPSFLDETSNGRSERHLRTWLLTDRKIFLDGEVTDEMAIQFAMQMEYLAQSKDPIDIYINSPGGSVNAGLVIYDIIQGLDGEIPINIYCIGMAASMGAVLLAGGQKGRRFILPHSKCMIHEPLIQKGIGGSATSIKETADSILETKAIICEILAKHTGKTTEEIDKDISFDNFMNAEKAVEYGICDEIKNIIGR